MSSLIYFPLLFIIIAETERAIHGLAVIGIADHLPEDYIRGVRSGRIVEEAFQGAEVATQRCHCPEDGV